jgi:hypothetical protein
VPAITIWIEPHSNIERRMDAEAVRPIQDHQAAKQTAPFPQGRKKARAPVGAKSEPTLGN